MSCGCKCAFTLPLLFPAGWISRRARKGFWTEALGPSSSHLPPSRTACYSVTSLLHEVTLVNGLRLQRQIPPERVSPNAKTRSFPYRSCTAANWGGGAGGLSASPAKHGGIMVSSRISGGYFEVDIFLPRVRRAPSSAPGSPISPLATDANAATILLLWQGACAAVTRIHIRVPRRCCLHRCPEYLHLKTCALKWTHFATLIIW